MSPFHLACKCPPPSHLHSAQQTRKSYLPPSHPSSCPKSNQPLPPPSILTTPSAPPLHLPAPPPHIPPPTPRHPVPTSSHAHAHPAPRTRLHATQEQRHIRHRRRHRPLTPHWCSVSAGAVEAAYESDRPCQTGLREGDVGDYLGRSRDVV